MYINKLLTFSCVAALATIATLFSTEARADDEGGKPGVLEGKPIVVNRMELRKLRIQVTPRATMTLSQPFNHVGFVGAKLQFDLADWIGVRGDFDYSVLAPNTALTDDLVTDVLPEGEDQGGGALARPQREFDNPAPLRHDFQAGLTRLKWTSSLGLVFTPFAGKLGLFQTLFTEYDLYLWGGYGFTNWMEAYESTQSTAESIGETSASCTDDECLLHPVDAQVGTRTGPAFGAGFHIFLTSWLSINPEFQDIIIRHNIAGLNATIDYPITVDGGDRVIVHNANFSLGFTVYLPPRAKRSTIKPR